MDPLPTPDVEHGPGGWPESESSAASTIGSEAAEASGQVTPRAGTPTQIEDLRTPTQVQTNVAHKSVSHDVSPVSPVSTASDAPHTEPHEPVPAAAAAVFSKPSRDSVIYEPTSTPTKAAGTAASFVVSHQPSASEASTVLSQPSHAGTNEDALMASQATIRAPTSQQNQPVARQESLGDSAPASTSAPNAVEKERQQQTTGQSSDPKAPAVSGAAAGAGAVAATSSSDVSPLQPAPSSSNASKNSAQRSAVHTPEDDPSHGISTVTGDKKIASSSNSSSSDDIAAAKYEPIKPAKSRGQDSQMSHLSPITSRNKGMSHAELIRTISRYRTNASDQAEDDTAEIQKLMSRMFGEGRQAHSQELQSRHEGVVFKHLTVVGQGLGAALQPTNADPFLGPYRTVKALFAGGTKAAFGAGPERTLISDFTGCAKPGEMVLVLGRPGAGCSTFLKVIGNQRNGFVSVAGDVTYGGATDTEMYKKYRSDVLYNPEDDLHYAALSVQNTLKFAIKTRTPGEESRLEGESRKDYVANFLQTVVKLFWIEHTLPTKVGDEMIRGVSGGEKKRVSIAEALITKASTQCWDNSTRGLDASTALEYAQSLRTLTSMANISTFVALYQAGENLYNLFDKVLLIDEGRCCYYGPAEQAKAYFEGLGFVCPPRWTTADFLTSVTDRYERQVKEGYEKRIPQSAAQFDEAFRKSHVAKENLLDIEAFEANLGEQKAKKDEFRAKSKQKQSNYQISFPAQVWACTIRQFRVIRGDPQSLFGKWGGILFQALIVGSLFYGTPDNSQGTFAKGGVMFFILLFNALLALAELTAAFSSRPIMLKHKSFSFYRPAAFAIAQVVADLPQCAAQVTIFNVVVYFMAGLQRTASQFFINWLISYILTLSMYSFFRSIGSVSDSLDSASRVTGVAIQALIVYTGYLIPPNKMHPWLGWLRWINPVQYGFEAMMSNEFYDATLDCVVPNLVPSFPNADPRYQGCALQGARLGSQQVSGADYIFTAYTYTREHLWRNFGIIVAFWIFFACLTALGMELQKPYRGGASVTVFKRGQEPKAIADALAHPKDSVDEEKGAKEVAAIQDEGESEGMSAEAKHNSPTQTVARNESVFTWQDVNYTIPVKNKEGDKGRKLLSDVEGFVRPGKLTALMGASGAGKTTLLNTLAQRITYGKIEGKFLVDGRPLPKSFQRATGFAEQMDVHEPTQTVKEALQFSALLRQPRETPIEEKYEYVETIIDLLEMREIAGATIGEQGAGLNQEQRKRLTIGVELASKPELLMFLDEPTSGLDSGAAYNIVRFLRKLADAGQAILCTIHQPSSVLFEEFDDLLLLKAGGRIVYHGELGKDSTHLIEYFKVNGAKPCPPATNPAEYMLDAIGAGNPDYKGKDWGDVWSQSKERRTQQERIESYISERRTAASTKATKDDREYAMPLGTQIRAVVRRCFVAYWRTPQYMLGKFILHIFTGLFNTFTYWKVGQSQIDMQSRLFAVFMTLTICPPLIQQLQPRFLKFRGIFTARERNSKIYSWIAITLGAVLVEIPYSLVAGTIYWNCWYWGIGFSTDSFRAAFSWLNMMLFELFYVSFGQFIAAFSPNELLASLFVPLFFLFVVSFCGIVVPYAALPTFWRSWMYWASPFTYILGGFLSDAIHDVPVMCSDDEFARFAPPPGTSCQAYVQPYITQAGGYVQTGPDGNCEFCQYASGDQFGLSFNVDWNLRWRYFGVTIGFVCFNFFLVFLFSWLFLGGAKRIGGLVSSKKRRENRERREAMREKSGTGNIRESTKETVEKGGKAGSGDGMV